MSKARGEPKPIPGVLVQDRGALTKERGRSRPGRKGLTPKERLAIKYLTQGCNPKEAALKAGYKQPNHVAKILNPNETQGKNFRKSFYAAMDRAGLSDGPLLRPIYEALRAGMVKWNPAKEGWDSFIDHRTRLDASKMGLELRGRFPRGDERGPMVAVTVLTNLQAPEEPGGAFTIHGQAAMVGATAEAEG